MRPRDLLGLMLLLALARTGLVCGQGPAAPASWAGSVADKAAGQGPPRVIATSKPTVPGALPADARLPLPDDGLRPPGKLPEGVRRAATPVVGEGNRGVQPVVFIESPPPPGGKPAPVEVRPVAPAEPAPRGSALSVDVVGPTTATPGQVVNARVVARNVGTAVLGGVRVTLPLPAGAKLLLAEPPPEQTKEGLVWEIGNLDAGAAREMKIDMQMAQPGELRLCPEARFTAAVGLRANVVRPPFSLEVAAPEKVIAGSPVPLQIHIGNHTRQPLRQVTLRCDLPAGLTHAQGGQIWADLGELAPGQVRTETLTVQASRAGRLLCELTATAEGGAKAQAQAVVVAADPSLALRLDGPRQGGVDRDLTFQLELSNPARAAAPRGEVTLVLPTGLDFVSAGDGGAYQAATRTVTWLLSGPGGEARQSVTLTARGRQAGDWALVAAARAEGLQEVRATHAIRLAAMPTLYLELTAHDSVLKVGSETVYELRLYNPGPSAAKDVRLAVTLPETLAPVAADGASDGRMSGTQVLYETLPLMRPRTDATFRLRVRGGRPGVGRLRASVFADGMERPAQQEVIAEVRGR